MGGLEGAIATGYTLSNGASIGRWSTGVWYAYDNKRQRVMCLENGRKVIRCFATAEEAAAFVNPSNTPEPEKENKK